MGMEVEVEVVVVLLLVVAVVAVVLLVLLVLLEVEFMLSFMVRHWHRHRIWRLENELGVGVCWSCFYRPPTIRYVGVHHTVQHGECAASWIWREVIQVIRSVSDSPSSFSIRPPLPPPTSHPKAKAKEELLTLSQ